MNLQFPTTWIPYSYTQRPQPYKTQFTFLNKLDNDTYIPIAPTMICRDYIGDIVYGNSTKTTMMTSNSWFKPETMSLDKDQTRLLLYSPNNSELENTLKNWSILTQIEDQNNLPHSTITECLHNKQTFYIIEGDPFWQSTVWLMSLYTFIIRCLCMPFFADRNNESQYKLALGDHWDILTNNLRQIKSTHDSITGWPNTQEISIHSSCGIVALFSKDSHINYYNNKRNINIYTQAFLQLKKQQGDPSSAASPVTPSSPTSKPPADTPTPTLSTFATAVLKQADIKPQQLKEKTSKPRKPTLRGKKTLTTTEAFW